MRKILSRTFTVCMLLGCMLLFPLTANARQCPKCHGSGWQTTIPDVGHYGVEKHKRRCPVCGEMVYSGHQDRCTQCGGSGHLEDRGSRDDGNSVADKRAAEGEISITSHLTSAEISIRQNLINSLFATKFVVDTCQICHGSRLCQQCGGFQTYNLDVDPSTICRACGGTGQCPTCRGQGNFGGHPELAFSQEERQRIAENIGVFNKLANLRASLGVSPEDPNGPRLGQDNNGNYYIQGDPSDGGGYYSDGEGYSGDSLSGDDSAFSTLKDKIGGMSHSKIRNYAILGILIIILGIICFAFIRRKK